MMAVTLGRSDSKAKGMHVIATLPIRATDYRGVVPATALLLLSASYGQLMSNLAVNAENIQAR